MSYYCPNEREMREQYDADRRIASYSNPSLLAVFAPLVLAVGLIGTCIAIDNPTSRNGNNPVQTNAATLSHR